MAIGESLLVGAVFAAVGGLVAYLSRGTSEQSRTLAELVPDGDGPSEPGAVTSVAGPVAVSEPASPARPPSDFVDADVPEDAAERLESLESDGRPALWLWGVRRKFDSGTQGASDYWETVEGAFEVGEFSVEEGWDDVRVDADSLQEGATADREAPVEGIPDPFDAPNVYLGDPEVDVPLGDPGPVNRLLERFGLADEDGALQNVEVTFSAGRKTSTPDHYQAQVVRDGDPVAVRGELTETPDGLAIRGGDGTPVTIATGDVEEKLRRTRRRSRQQRALGAGLVVVGVAVAALGVL